MLVQWTVGVWSISLVLLFFVFMFKLTRSPNREHPLAFRLCFTPSIALLGIGVNVMALSSGNVWLIYLTALATGYIARGMVYLWRG